MDALEAVRPAAEAAGAGNHRNPACWRTSSQRAGHAACAARARRAHLPWTISGPAIPVVELSAKLSVRQDQDRPVVRARPRRRQSANAQAIVRSIVSLGSSLGVTDHCRGRRAPSASWAALRAAGCNEARVFCSAARGPMRRSSYSLRRSTAPMPPPRRKTQKRRWSPSTRTSRDEVRKGRRPLSRALVQMVGQRQSHAMAQRGLEEVCPLHRAGCCDCRRSSVPDRARGKWPTRSVWQWK